MHLSSILHIYISNITRQALGAQAPQGAPRTPGSPKTPRAPRDPGQKIELGSEKKTKIFRKQFEINSGPENILKIIRNQFGTQTEFENNSTYFKNDM